MYVYLYIRSWWLWLLELSKINWVVSCEPKSNPIHNLFPVLSSPLPFLPLSPFASLLPPSCAPCSLFMLITGDQMLKHVASAFFNMVFGNSKGTQNFWDTTLKYKLSEYLRLLVYWYSIAVHFMDVIFVKFPWQFKIFSQQLNRFRAAITGLWGEHHEDRPGVPPLHLHREALRSAPAFLRDWAVQEQTKFWLCGTSTWVWYHIFMIIVLYTSYLFVI